MTSHQKKNPQQSRPAKPKSSSSLPTSPTASAEQQANELLQRLQELRGKSQSSPTGYEAKKQRAANVSKLKSLSGRDIGRCPDIKDPKRRELASKSCAAFFKTYNPKAFHLDWSKSQRNELDRMDEVVHYGAMSAIADPRGDGKTTRCRMLVLYAIANAYRFYPFLIGANLEKAQDSLASIGTMIRFLPDFADDFPEIAFAAKKLGGIANRSAGQISNGVSTLIQWSKERIVLPTMAPPANWPAGWKLRADGMVPTSGALIGVSGLTGDGIRGSLMTSNTGEMIRPDLVVIDDPQTAESARSRTQNETRYQLVSADVLGMAGPGKTIAAIMPCTVIERGDMVDQILDRKKNPLWRGERTQLMRSMPANMEAWNEYFEIYSACQQYEPPDLAKANAAYIERRAILDAGAEAGWEERKLPQEVSAIQHAMHLYFRNPRAFFSEYQNDPLPPTSEAESFALKTADLMEKLNSMKRGMVPRECTRVVAFVDVGKEILFYAVCAFSERFGGALLDYGAYPAQLSASFSSRNPEPSLSTVHPGKTDTAKIYAGLRDLIPAMLAMEFQQHGTVEKFKISKILIDSGYQAETIFKFVREQTTGGIVMPSKGYGILARRNPMNEWAKKPGERMGFNWREYPATAANKGRWIIYDANKWKSFAAERLRLSLGDVGSMSIFGSKENVSAGLHSMLFSHLCAEYPIEVSANGRTVAEWEQREGYENHWWDCLVGCCVAASVHGLQWTPDATPVRKPDRQKIDLEAKAKRGMEMPVL